MSEFVNTHTKTNTRLQLLAATSAIALIGAAFTAKPAEAADEDNRPSLWIELGGQLSQTDDTQETFTPAFPDSPPRPAVFSPSQKFEREPRYSFDESGAMSFEPQGSDWMLSASVLYGRASSNKHVHQQTHPGSFIITKYGTPAAGFPPILPNAARFADTLVRNDASHAVVDFQAGKDFGLGMFGDRGSSVLSLGVRFAQFQSKSSITLKSDPDWGFHAKYIDGLKIARQPYHSNYAHLSAARSFHGLGPSLSWKSSAPLTGDSQGNELTFDWGLNAAVLFGRQRAKVSHNQTGFFHSSLGQQGTHQTVYHPTPVHTDRAKTVTVPNVGGFAGATWRIQNVKVSAGYRADFFFHAMDGGTDAAKKENIGFYGPFASVSVGIGG